MRLVTFMARVFEHTVVVVPMESEFHRKGRCPGHRVVDGHQVNSVASLVRVKRSVIVSAALAPVLFRPRPRDASCARELSRPVRLALLRGRGERRLPMSLAVTYWVAPV